MLFNSNFSFAPKLAHASHEHASPHGTVEHNRDVPLSPRTRADSCRFSRGRLETTSLNIGIKKLDDRASCVSISSEVSCDSTVADSFASESTVFPPSPRSSISVASDPAPKMKFFQSRRRQSKQSDWDTRSPNSDSSVTLPAAHVNIPPSCKRQQAKPRQIIIPPRLSSAQEPVSLLPAFPKPPRFNRQQKPPVLRLDPSPISQPTKDYVCEFDPSHLSPLQAITPPANTQVQVQVQVQGNSQRHLKAANTFGIQMLVDTLNEDSSDEEEEEPELIPEQHHTSHWSSSGKRLEAVMPPIEESCESLSEKSSISYSFDGMSPILTPYDRRHSVSSTIPTSISEGSIGPNKRLSYSSYTTGHLSIPDEIDHLAPIPLSRTNSTKSHTLSSRQSSFCCRKSRSYSQSSSVYNRFSIGLGSIAASDIDLEADLEDSTHFPGIAELKQQISWLSLQSPELYDSDEESEEEEEDEYHQHLSTMASRESIYVPKKTPYVDPLLIASKSLRVLQPQPPAGEPMNAPFHRRPRRRTASSECVVLEALEEMRQSGLEASIESVGQRLREYQ